MLDFDDENSVATCVTTAVKSAIYLHVASVDSETNTRLVFHLKARHKTCRTERYVWDSDKEWPTSR